MRDENHRQRFSISCSVKTNESTLLFRFCRICEKNQIKWSCCMLRIMRAQIIRTKPQQTHTKEQRGERERGREIVKNDYLHWFCWLSVDLPVPYQISCIHTGHMLRTNMDRQQYHKDKRNRFKVTVCSFIHFYFLIFFIFISLSSSIGVIKIKLHFIF